LAKTTAPLFGFDAAGSLGKSIVFSRWRGRGYARRHTIPANPQSTEQTITRNAFSFLNAVYKVAPTQVIDVWQAAARGKPLTDRNAWIKANLSSIRDQADLTDLTISGGALGGIPPLSAVITPGNDQLSVLVTPQTVLPDGWTVNKAVVAAIEDQDPDSGTAYNITAGEDLTSTYTIVLALGSAILYQVRSWLVYNRPDGSLAYSANLSGTGLTT